MNNAARFVVGALRPCHKPVLSTGLGGTGRCPTSDIKTWRQIVGPPGFFLGPHCDVCPGAARSGQYPANHIAADVREPEVPSTMSIGQLLVIQAQEMKDG